MALGLNDRPSYPQRPMKISPEISFQAQAITQGSINPALTATATASIRVRTRNLAHTFSM